MLLDELVGLDDALPELVDVDDEVVARGYHHLGIGVDGLDVVRGPCDARCRVAPGRFEQYLAVLDFGQLLLDELSVTLVGNQQYVLDGDDSLDAVKRHLQQAASRTEEIKKLLGLCGFAEGPESAAYASAHDHAVSIVVHNDVLLFRLIDWIMYRLQS